MLLKLVPLRPCEYSNTGISGMNRLCFEEIVYALRRDPRPLCFEEPEGDPRPLTLGAYSLLTFVHGFVVTSAVCMALRSLVPTEIGDGSLAARP